MHQIILGKITKDCHHVENIMLKVLFILNLIFVLTKCLLLFISILHANTFSKQTDIYSKDIFLCKSENYWA